MFKVSCGLRSTDFDYLGHVNQSVYHQLFEAGRMKMMQAIWNVEKPQVVLARVELDYRMEIPYGRADEVEVSHSVESIGTTSFVLRGAMQLDSSIAAEGRFVIVAWDEEARGKRPLSQVERSGLEEYLLDGAGIG